LGQELFSSAFGGILVTDALKGVRTDQADRELQLCHSERSPSALVTLSEAKGLGCLRVNSAE
jgi:hypothetical protein